MGHYTRGWQQRGQSETMLRESFHDADDKMHEKITTKKSFSKRKKKHNDDDNDSYGNHRN